MPKKVNVERQTAIYEALNLLNNQATCSNPPLSVRRVALEYGIPAQTLRDAVAKNTISKRSGPPTILTSEEENELVGYCLNMQKIGFGLTKNAVNTMVMQIVSSQHRKHPFKDRPGKKWWQRFMRDHPELSFRVPQELSKARAAKGNPVVLQKHFETLQQIINEHSLTAERIWNIDETGFNLAPRLQKVLAKKGARQVHKTAAGNSNEHVSVCPTISAAGTYIPPLIIYKGVNVVEGLLSGLSVPPGTVAAFTNTGYMHEDIFRMYIEHFNQSIPPVRPVLLMLDGHSSHIDLISINFCRNNNILLYVLPSNTTHLLQPSEIPFRKLKDEFCKASDQYSFNTSRVVTKYSFAQLLGKAFNHTYTPNAIKKAYAVTGIWPLNPNAIKPDRLEPSLTTKKPMSPPHKPIQIHNTRASRVSQLERENQELREYIQRLEHPGTSSIVSIMKYPHPKPCSSQEETQRRPKNFKFGALVTADIIAKELNDKEEEKQRKIEEVRLRKEQRAIKKAEKEEAKQKKAQERLNKGKKKKVNMCTEIGSGA
jgi:hypothetical protein